MAFKIEFPNLALYMDRLKELNGRKMVFLINTSLYEGARVLAEAVQDEISGLKELNAVQRKGLHDGLGIAHFWKTNDGTVTKVGFEGYNYIKTERWPKGQPNAMIARSLIRGTSWMQANRFTQRAAKKAKERSIAAMQTTFDEGIVAIMKDMLD